MDTSKRVSAWWMAALVAFLTAMLLAFAPAKAYADLPVRNSDATTPSANCIFVGVEGRYLYPDGGLQAALNRINQIRKEAYNEGLVSRYNPIKWSYDLQNVAMTRAAEESIFLGHARPNGKSCFSASSNGVSSNSEDLAWNWSGMLGGIEQWYSEKSAYVNHTGGETGHYTSMINPNFNYIGIAAFTQPYGAYPCCVAAELSPRTGLNEKMSTEYGDCMQVIEYKPSYFNSDITLYQDTVPRTLKSGEAKTLSAYADCAYGPELPVLAGLNWMSTNPSAVTVDGSGNIKAVAPGSATIWATCNGSDADLSWKFDVVKTISVKKNLTTNTREQNGKVTVESLKDEAVGKGGTLTMVATQDGTPATKYPVVGKTTAFKVTSNPGCTLKSFYVTYTDKNGVKQTLTNGKGLTRVGGYKPSANTYEFTVPDANDVTITVAWDRAVTSINKTLTCGSQVVYNEAVTDGGTCEMVATQSGIGATKFPTVGAPTAFKVTNKEGYAVKAFNVTYTDKATGMKKTLNVQNGGLTRVGDYKPTANTYEFKVPDAADVRVNVTWVAK